MAKWGWGHKETREATGSDKKEVSYAWHTARDDSGRDKTDYGAKDFRNNDWKTDYAGQVQDHYRESGLTNPGGTVGLDKGGSSD